MSWRSDGTQRVAVDNEHESSTTPCVPSTTPAGHDALHQHKKSCASRKKGMHKRGKWSRGETAVSEGGGGLSRGGNLVVAPWLGRPHRRGGWLRGGGFYSPVVTPRRACSLQLHGLSSTAAWHGRFGREGERGEERGKEVGKSVHISMPCQPEGLVPPVSFAVCLS